MADAHLLDLLNTCEVYHNLYLGHNMGQDPA